MKNQIEEITTHYEDFWKQFENQSLPNAYKIYQKKMFDAFVTLMGKTTDEKEIIQAFNITGITPESIKKLMEDDKEAFDNQTRDCVTTTRENNIYKWEEELKTAKKNKSNDEIEKINATLKNLYDINKMIKEYPGRVEKLNKILEIITNFKNDSVTPEKETVRIKNFRKDLTPVYIDYKAILLESVDLYIGMEKEASQKIWESRNKEKDRKEMPCFILSKKFLEDVLSLAKLTREDILTAVANTDNKKKFLNAPWLKSVTLIKEFDTLIESREKANQLTDEKAKNDTNFELDREFYDLAYLINLDTRTNKQEITNVINAFKTIEIKNVGNDTIAKEGLKKASGLQQGLITLDMKTFASKFEANRNLINLIEDKYTKYLLLLDELSKSKSLAWNTFNKRNLSSFNCTSMNLSYAKIVDCDLEDFDCSYSTLEHADVTGSNLKNAKFINTIILNTDFSYSDLRNTDFTGAKRDHTTKFDFCKIAGSTLEKKWEELNCPIELNGVILGKIEEPIATTKNTTSTEEEKTSPENTTPSKKRQSFFGTLGKKNATQTDSNVLNSSSGDENKKSTHDKTSPRSKRTIGKNDKGKDNNPDGSSSPTRTSLDKYSPQSSSESSTDKKPVRQQNTTEVKFDLKTVTNQNSSPDKQMFESGSTADVPSGFWAAKVGNSGKKEPTSTKEAIKTTPLQKPKLEKKQTHYKNLTGPSTEVKTFNK